MRKLIFLISLICNLLASNSIPIENNFTEAEKEYILSNSVTLGMLKEYYPFSFKEKDQIIGFSHDYINLIRKKSALKIKIDMDDWSVILNKFKDKKIDLIDVISYSKDRASYTNFSKPYFEIPNVIFARKGEIKIIKVLNL